MSEGELKAPIPIAVLASGAGTNFEAIAASIAAGELRARIVALVCDQPQAKAIEKARARGIPAVVAPFPERDGTSIEERRRSHEERILRELAPLAPRFLVMAGYMRIVTPKLVEAFRSERGYTRIVNIHPSLLPSFPGVKSYAQAFRFGVKITGVTIHLVEHEVDSGPICAQEAFSIEGCASEEEVEVLGHQVEHRLYPRTLRWVLEEKFRVESRDFGELAMPGGRPMRPMATHNDAEKNHHRRLCVCPI